MWPFNTGACLIKLTTRAGLTVYHSRVTHHNRSVMIYKWLYWYCDYRMKNNNSNTVPLLQYCFRCTVGFSLMLIYIHITSDHQGWKTLSSWIIHDSIAVNGKYRNGKAILIIQILSFNFCEIRSWENLSVMLFQ